MTDYDYAGIPWEQRFDMLKDDGWKTKEIYALQHREWEEEKERENVQRQQRTSQDS